jgi:hypothetical protein
MKYLIALLLLVATPCVSLADELPPELQSDDAAPVVAGGADIVYPDPVDSSPDLERRVADLEDWARKTVGYLNRMNDRILTEAEVREIVRNEFAQLTIKQADGKLTRKTVSVSPSSTTTFGLPDGAVVTHINGVPVNQSGYYSNTVNAPVTRYVSPVAEVRTYRRRGRVFGFLRARSTGSCRVVNGRTVCN